MKEVGARGVGFRWLSLNCLGGPGEDWETVA